MALSPPQTLRRLCGVKTAFGAVAKNAPCFTVVTAENSIHGKQTMIFAAMGRERSQTMTELEKTVYQNMRPIDRVMTYLIK